MCLEAGTLVNAAKADEPRVRVVVRANLLVPITHYRHLVLFNSNAKTP